MVRPAGSAQRTRYETVVRPEAEVISPTFEARPLTDERPLSDDNPLIEDRPLSDARPLIEDRPLVEAVAAASDSFTPEPSPSGGAQPVAAAAIPRTHKVRWKVFIVSLLR